MLEYLERSDRDAKYMFRLVPYNDVEVRHVPILPETLFAIAKRLRCNHASSLHEFEVQEADSFFQRWFDFKKLIDSRQVKVKGLEGKLWKFSSMTSNGHNVCFSFLVPQKPPPKRPPKRPPKLPPKPSPKPPRAPAGASAPVVIGLDPGEKNIFTAAFRREDGTVKIVSLSQKQYYTLTGINKDRRRSKRWLKRAIPNEKRVWSTITTKTTDLKLLGDFVDHYAGIFVALWDEKTKIKYRRQRYRRTLSKRRVMDTALQRVKTEAGPNCEMAYGDGKWAPSAPFRKPSPQTATYKAALRQFTDVTLVSEFRTSSVCNKCGSQLRDITRVTRVNGRISYFTARGVKNCIRCGCVDRDANAALNILDCCVDPEGRKWPLLQRGDNENWARPTPAVYIRRNNE